MPSFPELRAKTLESALTSSFLSQDTSNLSAKLVDFTWKEYPESDYVSPYSPLPPVQTGIFSHLGYSNSLWNGIPAFALCPTHHQYITNKPARGMTMSQWKSDHVIPLPISLSVKAKVLQRTMGLAATESLLGKGPTSELQSWNLNFNNSCAHGSLKSTSIRYDDISTTLPSPCHSSGKLLSQDICTCHLLYLECS